MKIFRKSYMHLYDKNNNFRLQAHVGVMESKQEATKFVSLVKYAEKIPYVSNPLKFIPSFLDHIFFQSV